MGTIDIFNLIQFLFRRKVDERPKAEVAAEFLNDRVPNCNRVPHFNKPQHLNDTFHRQSHMIVYGLSSVLARKQSNEMLISPLT